MEIIEYENKCENCGCLKAILSINEDRKSVVCSNCGFIDDIFVSKELLKKWELEKQESQKPTVTCPYCKSTNTKKIGSVSRFVSTGVFGLASKKIAKEWHCNRCKSDF